MKKCERCSNKHDGMYGSGRFCSEFCARARTQTEETRKRIGKTLTKTIGKKKKIIVLSDLSTRTISKVFNRLKKFENIGCSRCGWKEGTCDVHHINGRKIDNFKSHDNLSYICPNCHRLVHNKIIDKNELISIKEQIGDKWRKYYYG